MSNKTEILGMELSRGTEAVLFYRRSGALLNHGSVH